MNKNSDIFPLNELNNPEKYSGQIKKVRKNYLINRLNFINFQDETILLAFKHVKYDHRISLKAKPLPCVGDELECIWLDSEKEKYAHLTSYKFQEIRIANGKNMLVVNPKDIFVSEEGAHLLLPEIGHEVCDREYKRYKCKGINAQLIQNSASFEGMLVDFNAVSLCVEVNEVPPQTFLWLDCETNVNLILSNDTKMLYAGECRIGRWREAENARRYIIEPLHHQLKRFKPKDFRINRQELVPSPVISFKHPFTHRMTTLKIVNLSGAGFRVEENIENAVLLPGMILPSVKIDFAKSFSATCKCQVVYQTLPKKGRVKDKIRCGIAILDMDLEEHTKVLSLLHQAKDPNTFINNAVDQNDLWRFFFESGFIYPKKYAFIQKNKEYIKDTYRKIYSGDSKIAKHFIYQDNGRILGHMAFIRFFQRSWLIHHHAADRAKFSRAGIGVLDQIGQFINETHLIFPHKMGFVFCYFRPENKFPERTFGGVYRNIGNPKSCSLDTFSYFHVKHPGEGKIEIRNPWRLIDTQKQDLVELEIFYEADSGGQMLNALELKGNLMNIKKLKDEYRKMEFKREKYLFSLKKDNTLKAVFMVNISDIGLNLSNITNSIHAFVIDPDELSKTIFYSALSKLLKMFDKNTEIPVLLYPTSFADTQSIPYEKKYNLWVMDVQYLDPYFKYLYRFFKRYGTISASFEK